MSRIFDGGQRQSQPYRYLGVSMVRSFKHREKALHYNVYAEQRSVGFREVLTQRPHFRVSAGVFLPCCTHAKAGVPGCAYKHRQQLGVVGKYPCARITGLVPSEVTLHARSNACSVS